LKWGKCVDTEYCRVFESRKVNFTRFHCSSFPKEQTRGKGADAAEEHARFLKSCIWHYSLSCFSKPALTSFLWAQDTEGHFRRYRREAANTLGDVTDTKIFKNHLRSLRNVKLFSRAPNLYECHHQGMHIINHTHAVTRDRTDAKLGYCLEMSSSSTLLQTAASYWRGWEKVLRGASLAFWISSLLPSSLNLLGDIWVKVSELFPQPQRWQMLSS